MEVTGTHRVRLGGGALPSWLRALPNPAAERPGDRWPRTVLERNALLVDEETARRLAADYTRTRPAPAYPYVRAEAEPVPADELPAGPADQAGPTHPTQLTL